MLRSKNKLLELTALLVIALPAATATANTPQMPGETELAHPKSVMFSNEDKSTVDPLNDIVETLDYAPPLYTGENADVWARIRTGFAIPDLNNDLVAKHQSWYTARPEYFDRTTKRASLYLYHVVQELEKRNMPMELALLPFIESAFNPHAVSVAQAAGMWQFVPGTGRDYNLKQDMFRDDRRSVIKSTDAALSYLQRLHGMFGDWQLALAAYNWGEGSVQRAIKKSKAAGGGTDFESLAAYMPAETRNYVPKLQAVKNIISNPDVFGVRLSQVDNEPYFTVIPKTRDIDVNLAAKLAEMPVTEFKALNPQFNKPVIVGSNNTQILLPKSNAAKFKENISNWTETLSSWTSHKVVSAKEKIETIAARFKTTPSIIREVNNIPLKMAVRAGSTILVPKTEASHDRDISADVADDARIMMVADRPDTRRVLVKVGKRDTLASIAQKYKVDIANILHWNKLDTESVKRGQKLRLEVPLRFSASAGTGDVLKTQSQGRYRTDVVKNARAATVNRKAVNVTSKRVSRVKASSNTGSKSSTRKRRYR